MKKFVLTIFSITIALIIIFFVFVFAVSQPVPEGTEQIMEEVFSSVLPQQIIGDTGLIASGHGVQIWYESINPQGKTKGTFLFIMGLGGNAIEWPLYFIKPLVDEGYQVIRFDNRSTGLSSWVDENFSLDDMADDAIAVMDALNIDKAHIFGMSLGGMIGQKIAIEQPERVASLISFMSSGFSDDPELPSISRSHYLSLIATGIRHGIPSSEKNIVKTTISVRSVLTPELSPKRIKVLAEQSLFNQRYRKGFNPKAFIQQTKVVRNAGSRYEGLRTLKMPVLVIHGKQDPLIPVEHGIKTAQMVHDAELLILDGMGHDISPEHTPSIHEAILKFIKKSD